MKQTETQLVKQCVACLMARGFYVWRNNTGLTRLNYTDRFGHKSERVWKSGMVGSSDILGIANDGKFIAVECKVGNNKPSQYQKDFLDEIQKRGGYAYVVYSVDELEGLL